MDGVLLLPTLAVGHPSLGDRLSLTRRSVQEEAPDVAARGYLPVNSASRLRPRAAVWLTWLLVQAAGAGARQPGFP
jgi:hypothetical protein